MSVEGQIKQDLNSENTELIERKELKDTPFVMVGTEQGWFGAIGKHRITELKETEKEVKKELEEVTWNRIVQVILIVTENQRER